MSDRSDYTDNTVIIADLTAADVIHVHFRRRPAEQQLADLKGVTGVTRLEMIQGSYTARVCLAPLHYGASVGLGRAFSFNELAPQIIVVVADALGINLDKLDLRIEQGGTRSERNSKPIMDAARALRKQPAPRNPHYEFAATADDLVPGTKLLQANWALPPYGGNRWGFIKAFTVADRPVKSYCAGNMVYTTTETSSPSPGEGDFYLMARLGIEPYESGQWNDCVLTIVNTAENRRKLVKWLLDRGNPIAEESAAMILEQYPDDFTAKVVIEDGKLTTKIS